MGLPPFVDKEGEEVSLSERPGPLLLYFSAHWCPPCRGFTPKLVEFFSELEKKYPRPPSPSSRPIKIARPGRLIFNPWARTGSVCRTTRAITRRSSRRPLAFPVFPL